MLGVLETIPQRFEEAIVGLHVTHTWMGHGSAIMLEFGRLTHHKRRDSSPGEPTGEVSLMIEWSWRIEKTRSILGGSWSAEKSWPSMIEKLKGATVTSIRTFGVLPEIAISLSNGLRVTSFMTAEGQPSWALIAYHLGDTLCVKRGKLYAEPIKGA